MRTEAVGLARLRRVAAIVGVLLLAGCASSSPPRKSSASGPANRSTPPVERGEASFYGGKYHGRITASGEVFNKNALTAAHPRLSFGTNVRVTNVENGKNVVVRINDRFPGTKGRIIDLSEGAFQRLAPLARGVILVTVEVVR